MGTPVEHMGSMMEYAYEIRVWFKQCQYYAPSPTYMLQQAYWTRLYDYRFFPCWFSFEHREVINNVSPIGLGALHATAKEARPGGGLAGGREAGWLAQPASRPGR